MLEGKANSNCWRHEKVGQIEKKNLSQELRRYQGLTKALATPSEETKRARQGRPRKKIYNSNSIIYIYIYIYIYTHTHLYIMASIFGLER